MEMCESESFLCRPFEDTFEDAQWENLNKCNQQYEDTFENAQWRKIKQLWPVWLCIRVFQKTKLFQENQKYNPPRISLGVSLKGSKRTFDFNKVYGCLEPHPSWPLLHCRFSLGPHMAGLRVGRVKIYNIKQVKTEVARGTPKLCRNQKSFWILSN